MTKDTQIFVPIYNFNDLSWQIYLEIALNEFADLNMMDRNDIFNFYVPFVIRVWKVSNDYSMPNRYTRRPYLTFLPKHIAFFDKDLLKNYIEHVEIYLAKKLKDWREEFCSIEPVFNIIKSGLNFEDTLYSHRYYTTMLQEKFNELIKDLDYVKLRYTKF